MHDSWKPYDHIQTTYWDVTVYPQEPMATPVPNITKYSSAEYHEKDETWVGGRVECICVESCSLQVAVKVVLVPGRDSPPGPSRYYGPRSGTSTCIKHVMVGILFLKGFPVFLAFFFYSCKVGPSN